MRRKRSRVLRLTSRYLPDRPKLSILMSRPADPIRRMSLTTHHQVFNEVRQEVIFGAYELTVEWYDELS